MVKKAILFAAVLACLTALLPPSAAAALLSGDDLFYNPWDVPEAEYTQVTCSGGSPYAWAYDNVQSVQVLPLLQPYAAAPSDPGGYPTSYVFTQADYHYQANVDYSVDLTGGVATATFLGAGVYHVNLRLADNTNVIQAVIVDTGFLGDNGNPAQTGPEVAISGPHADLVVVSHVPNTDPEAAKKNEALDNAANSATADGQTVVRAEGAGDAALAIRAASRAAGRPIHVELVAHGQPGHLEIGSDGVGCLPTDTYTTQKFQEFLDGYVSGLSTYACSYGAGKEGNDALQTLANSLGWASGWTTTVTAHYNEHSHGFDLAMGSGGLSTVPEPATLVMLVSGLACCLGRFGLRMLRRKN